MTSSDPAAFGYQIRRADGGWAWVAYGPDGAVARQGWTAEKALAAALVIRALARAAAPGARRVA